jgi:hypothetical protein
VVSDLGTFGRRSYLGLTTGVKQREGKLRASAAYTWSRLAGYGLDNDESTEYGENPGQTVYLWGPLNDDARHVIKLAMTYRISSWLSSGLTFRYLSGRPYSTYYRNDVLADTSDLRAQRGKNPGSDINDPGDDRAQRLPDQQQVNLQVRGDLAPLTGQRLEAYMDVMNVLALRTTTQVVQEQGDTFGRSTARMAPFSLRFGFRYRY